MCIPQAAPASLDTFLPIDLSQFIESKQPSLFDPSCYAPARKARAKRIPVKSIASEADAPKGRPLKPVDTAKEQLAITAAKDAVLRVFRVHHTLLDRHCKKPEAVIPRQTLFYLLYHVGAIPQRRIAEVALTESWEKFTVTNAIRVARDVMTVDDRYKSKVLKAMRIMMNDLKRTV